MKGGPKIVFSFSWISLGVLTFLGVEKEAQFKEVGV